MLARSLNPSLQRRNPPKINFGYKRCRLIVDEHVGRGRMVDVPREAKALILRSKLTTAEIMMCHALGERSRHGVRWRMAR